MGRMKGQSDKPRLLDLVIVVYDEKSDRLSSLDPL
jgi:7,8-dihydro-6-hydroxymethylpterin-pyrophosphokinase